MVDDPRAVDILVDRAQVRFLAPFLGTAATPAAAARSLGVSLNVLLPRIHRFVEVGLLEVVHVERRRGRPLRHYCTVAPEFFVPLQHVRLERDMFRSHLHWDRLFRTALERELLTYLSRRTQSGVRVVRTPEGTALIELAEGTGPPGDKRPPMAVFEWFVLRLDADDARQLQAELAALAQRFQRRQTEGTERYLLGTQLAPLPADAVT